MDKMSDEEYYNRYMRPRDGSYQESCQTMCQTQCEIYTEEEIDAKLKSKKEKLARIRKEKNG